MDKKGEVTFEQLVLTIAALFVVFILFAAIVKIWNATHPEQFSTEKKDLKRIASEIKDLKNGDQIYVPTFSTDYYEVKFVKTSANKISGCSRDYCVCYVKDGKYVTCETFDIDMKVFSYKESECKEVTIKENAQKTGLNQILLERKDCDITLDYPTPKQ